MAESMNSFSDFDDFKDFERSLYYGRFKDFERSQHPRYSQHFKHSQDSECSQNSKTCVWLPVDDDITLIPVDDKIFANPFHSCEAQPLLTKECGKPDENVKRDEHADSGEAIVIAVEQFTKFTNEKVKSSGFLNNHQNFCSCKEIKTYDDEKQEGSPEPCPPNNKKGASNPGSLNGDFQPPNKTQGSVEIALGTSHAKSNVKINNSIVNIANLLETFTSNVKNEINAGDSALKDFHREITKSITNFSEDLNSLFKKFLNPVEDQLKSTVPPKELANKNAISRIGCRIITVIDSCFDVQDNRLKDIGNWRVDETVRFTKAEKRFEKKSKSFKNPSDWFPIKICETLYKCIGWEPLTKYNDSQIDGFNLQAKFIKSMISNLFGESWKKDSLKGFISKPKTTLLGIPHIASNSLENGDILSLHKFIVAVFGKDSTDSYLACTEKIGNIQNYSNAFKEIQKYISEKGGEESYMNDIDPAGTPMVQNLTEENEENEENEEAGKEKKGKGKPNKKKRLKIDLGENYPLKKKKKTRK